MFTSSSTFFKPEVKSTEIDQLIHPLIKPPEEARSELEKMVLNYQIIKLVGQSTVNAFLDNVNSQTSRDFHQILLTAHEKYFSLHKPILNLSSKVLGITLIGSVFGGILGGVGGGLLFCTLDALLKGAGYVGAASGAGFCIGGGICACDACCNYSQEKSEMLALINNFESLLLDSFPEAANSKPTQQVMEDSNNDNSRFTRRM